MGVDVQRGGHLRVPQQPGNRGHIRPAGDHKAGRRMPETVDVQVQGQVVLFEDQLESPGKSARGHGQIFSMAAEDVVLWGEGAPLMELQLPLAERLVLLQQACHLQGKVDITAPLPELMDRKKRDIMERKGDKEDENKRQKQQKESSAAAL